MKCAGNNLGNDGASVVFDSLKSNNSITTLDLASSNIRDLPFDFLGTNTILSTLILTSYASYVKPLQCSSEE